jgi:hypothetical protein
MMEDREDQMKRPMGGIRTDVTSRQRITRALSAASRRASEVCIDRLRSGDSRLGWMFASAYVCVVIGLAAIFVPAGDMGGMILVILALPWSALSTGGFFLGGLVLNGAIAFLAGCYLWPPVLHRIRLRMEETERFRRRQEESDE